MKQVKESFGKDHVKWLKDCCGNHEAAEKKPFGTRSCKSALVTTKQLKRIWSRD